MEDVGANGLICVSQVGFPKSIIEQVENRIGPRVRLVTLRSDDSDRIKRKLSIFPWIVMSNVDVDIQKLSYPEFWEPPPEHPVTIDFQGKVVSKTGDPKDAVTIGRLAQRSVMTYVSCSGKKLVPLAPQVVNVNINIDGTESSPLFLHTRDGVLCIRNWKFNVDAKRIDTRIPVVLSTFDYVQEFHEDSLAWVVTTFLDFPDVPREARVVFVPDGKGNFQASVQLKPLPVNKSARKISATQWLSENNVPPTPVPSPCPQWDPPED